MQLLPTSCPPPRGITTAPLTAAELELLDMATKGFWISERIEVSKVSGNLSFGESGTVVVARYRNEDNGLP